MAGIMDFVKVVNRTTEKLDAMFDGVPIDLVPGYKIVDDKVEPAGENGQPAYTMLPAPAAERAKWQNPQMGTADPENPTDVEFKVGVEAWGDDISFLPPTDAIELIDRSLLDDQARTATAVLTKVGRRLTKKAKRRQAFTDAKLKNVVFDTKTDYND